MKRLNDINPLVDNYMAGKLKKAQHPEKIKRDKDEKQSQQGYYDQINISKLGKFLLHMQNLIEAEDNKKALEGFYNVVNAFRYEESFRKITAIINYLLKLEKDDPHQIILLFEKAVNYDKNELIDTLLNLYRSKKEEQSR